jgi:hypothetical protein
MVMIDLNGLLYHLVHIYGFNALDACLEGGPGLSFVWPWPIYLDAPDEFSVGAL